MGRRQQAQEQLARTLDAKEKKEGEGVGDSENPLATYWCLCFKKSPAETQLNMLKIDLKILSP